MIGLMEDHDQSAGSAEHDFRKARRKKAELRDPAKVDKLPPHSAEAEQGVLGSIMLSPNDCMSQCVLKIEPDGFYDLRHRAIYEALLEMYNERVPIELITIVNELRDKCQLESIGGLAYLTSLPDTVPSAANLEYYLEILRGKHVLRQMIGTCTEVVSRAYEHQGEVDQLLDEVNADINRLATRRTSGVIKTARQLIPAAITDIETDHQRQGTLSGIETGFCDLDRLICGFQSGEMMLIAARPSQGKSSLMMNMAEHVAVNLRLPVGISSAEMTAESLMKRMLCARARVNLRAARNGELTDRDFARLTGASQQINASPLYIDDSTGMTITQLKANARRLHQQYGIRILFVDYVQRIRGSSGKRYETRAREVADVSVGLSDLAKELRIPVVALAQLGREYDKDKSRKPRLSDLRESGDLEQDADTVAMLYKPKSEDDEETPQNGFAFPMNLLIAKQRNGPTDIDVKLTFVKGYTRFESAAPISNEDVPE